MPIYNTSKVLWFTVTAVTSVGMGGNQDQYYMIAAVEETFIAGDILDKKLGYVNKLYHIPFIRPLLPYTPLYTRYTCINNHISIHVMHL